MDASELFQKICSILEQSPQDINPISYKTFIATLKPLTFKDNTLYLITPSDTHRRHLMTVTMMHAYLVSALNIVLDSPGADIVLVLESEAPAIIDTTLQPKASIPYPMLNERYTFENFVIGSGNQFAFAAALSVAEAPATINNPLFIYGGVGLGKTHLMHAIGNHILKYKPDTKVLYITCEKYTNEYIRSVSKHQIDAFRDKYRENVDVLMIDDVQFLTKKEHTQEEIFHNINDLFASNKQIILSSDRPPKSIQTLSDRLCSRFEGGLLVDITPPDLETRAAILRKKAEIDKIDIDDSILLFIAERASDNVRELEGALKRITVFASTTGQPITIDLAGKVLRDYNAEIQKHCTSEMIISTVAEYFNITPEDILGPRRDKPIVQPRHIAYYLCRELTSLSNKRIGDEFNGRDHATIINGIGKIRTALKTDIEIKNCIEDITMRLKGE
ncbi:MAG: chromosomal replication initiator protein DnaA [Clostridiales bacterium]|nr:chromosomal replication initiator protein DnaA [Clostridiales bacterium]